MKPAECRKMLEDVVICMELTQKLGLHLALHLNDDGTIDVCPKQLIQVVQESL